MNYITILTPDNIEIEYRLAGPGSRIAAALIDTLIQAAIFVIVLLAAFYIVLGGSLSNIFDLDRSGWFLGIMIGVFFIIYFCYYIVSELMLNGQTIGKKVYKLRAIRENGSPIGLTQSLIRNIIKLLIDSTGIGVIIIMFSKKCKRLGDMAASTVVIAENPDKVSFEPYELLNHAHVYSDINNNLIISDNEYRLLKDYFARKNSFTDKGASALQAFQEYFSEKFTIPKEMLTEDVLYRILRMN